MHAYKYTYVMYIVKHWLAHWLMVQRLEIMEIGVPENKWTEQMAPTISF